MELVRIYVARDEMEAHLLQQQLAEEGIRSTVLGGTLAQGRGELPFTSCTLPVLWVESGDAERAMATLRGLAERPAAGAGEEPLPWTCPQCREEIEPQFAVCWSCLTPRPGETESGAAEAGGMAEADEPGAEGAVDSFMRCVGCGYDLRMLELAGRCPECGLPILLSILRAMGEGEEANGPELLGLFARVARRCGRPASAVLLVGQAWRSVYESMIDLAESQAGPLARVAAAELCAALRRESLAYAGDALDERKVLRSWRITSGENVGQIVEAMIQGQVMHPDAIDPPEAFGGLCVLGDHGEPAR